jgi:hypothetical protein
LVKIALPFYTAGGFDEKRATPNAKMTSLWMMAPYRRLAAHARMSNSDQLSATLIVGY